MRMKTLIQILPFILPFPLALAAEATVEAVSFPVNHGAEVAREPSRHDGELVAVEVRIVEMTDKGHNGQTYMKAEFPDGSTIWLAAIGRVSDVFEVGDIIHVLGYVAAVHSDYKETVKLNHSGWHIISICYYNFRTKNETRFKFKHEPNLCTDWRDGKISTWRGMQD